MDLEEIFQNKEKVCCPNDGEEGFISKSDLPQ